MLTPSVSADSLPIIVRHRPRPMILVAMFFMTLVFILIARWEIQDHGIGGAIVPGFFFVLFLGLYIYGLISKSSDARIYELTRETVTSTYKEDYWSESLDNYKGVQFEEIPYKGTIYRVQLVHRTDSSKNIELARRTRKWPTKVLWIKVAKLLDLDGFFVPLDSSTALRRNPSDLGKPLTSLHAKGLLSNQFDPTAPAPEDVQWSNERGRLVAIFKSDGTIWHWFALLAMVLGPFLLLLAFFLPIFGIVALIAGLVLLHLMAAKVYFKVSCTPATMAIVAKSLGIPLRRWSLPLADMEIVKAVGDGYLHLESAFKSVSIGPLRQETAQWMETFLISAIVNAPREAAHGRPGTEYAGTEYAGTEYAGNTPLDDDNARGEQDNQSMEQDRELTIPERQPEPHWQAHEPDRNRGWRLPPAWRSFPLDSMLVRFGLFLNWTCTLIGMTWFLLVVIVFFHSSRDFSDLGLLLIILVPGGLAILLGRGIMFVLSGR